MDAVTPVATALAAAVLATAASSPGPGAAPGSPGGPAPRGPLGRYLSRPVLAGPHGLPHGVLALEAATGVPHLYRLGLRLGLLDHLTVGGSAHLLPGQRRPRFAPDVSLTFFRTRHVAAGARYHFQLERPPPLDADPQTPSFERRVHYLTTHVVAGARYVAGGVEVGWARGRIFDPRSPDPDRLVRPAVTVDRLAGGLTLRAGTRRAGVTLRLLWPFFVADVSVDVRFGLFEVPPRSRRASPERPVFQYPPRTY